MGYLYNFTNFQTSCCLEYTRGHTKKFDKKHTTLTIRLSKFSWFQHHRVFIINGNCLVQIDLPNIYSTWCNMLIVLKRTNSSTNTQVFVEIIVICNWVLIWLGGPKEWPAGHTIDSLFYLLSYYIKHLYISCRHL